MNAGRGADIQKSIIHIMKDWTQLGIRVGGQARHVDGEANIWRAYLCLGDQPPV
jgi:hypothetical protein